jgi:hypothetical protein
MFLGVSGKLGVGKNYVTENYIVPKIIKKFSNNNIQIIPYFFSFGTHPKIDLYSKDSTEYLNYYNLFVKKSNTTREMIQNYATQNGRNSYRKDMWIRAVSMWSTVQKLSIDEVNKHLDKKIVPLFVVEDVRFENEHEFIKSNSGLLVLIESRYRNCQKKISEINSGINDILHESEQGLEHLEFDIRINNDPINSDTIEDTIDIWLSTITAFN